MQEATYDKISPTAKLVAEMRRFSDIPFAAAIAERIGASETVRTLLGGAAPSERILSWMAPALEARYKSLASRIRASGVRQVVELAAGFSFRGHAMAAKENLLYVETDLPEMHETRSRLRAELEAAGVLPRTDRVVFLPLNAMNPAHLARLESVLKPQEPVAVVHEGLLQYFTMPEKSEVANAVAGILRRHDGLWITPDFEPMVTSFKERAPDPQLTQLIEAIYRSTERNFRDNSFADDDAITNFFEAVGFRLEKRPQIDGTFHLSSAERLRTAPAALEMLKESRALWELRLR